MLSVIYAGTNAYSAGITGALLRVDASGANIGPMVSHCGEAGGRGGPKNVIYESTLVPY